MSDDANKLIRKTLLRIKNVCLSAYGDIQGFGKQAHRELQTLDDNFVFVLPLFKFHCDKTLLLFSLIRKSLDAHEKKIRETILDAEALLKYDINTSPKSESNDTFTDAIEELLMAAKEEKVETVSDPAPKTKKSKLSLIKIDDVCTQDTFLEDNTFPEDVLANTSQASTNTGNDEKQTETVVETLVEVVTSVNLGDSANPQNVQKEKFLDYLGITKTTSLPEDEGTDAVDKSTNTMKEESIVDKITETGDFQKDALNRTELLAFDELCDALKSGGDSPAACTDGSNPLLDPSTSPNDYDSFAEKTDIDTVIANILNAICKTKINDENVRSQEVCESSKVNLENVQNGDVSDLHDYNSNLNKENDEEMKVETTMDVSIVNETDMNKEVSNIDEDAVFDEEGEHEKDYTNYNVQCTTAVRCSLAAGKENIDDFEMKEVGNVIVDDDTKKEVDNAIEDHTQCEEVDDVVEQGNIESKDTCNVQREDSCNVQSEHIKESEVPSDVQSEDTHNSQSEDVSHMQNEDVQRAADDMLLEEQQLRDAIKMLRDIECDTSDIDSLSMETDSDESDNEELLHQSYPSPEKKEILAEQEVPPELSELIPLDINFTSHDEQYYYDMFNLKSCSVKLVNINKEIGPCDQDLSRKTFYDKELREIERLTNLDNLKRVRRSSGSSTDTKRLKKRKLGTKKKNMGDNASMSDCGEISDSDSPGVLIDLCDSELVDKSVSANVERPPEPFVPQINADDVMREILNASFTDSDEEAKITGSDDETDVERENDASKTQEKNKEKASGSTETKALDEETLKRKKWRYDKLLTGRLSESSSDEDGGKKKERKKDNEERKISRRQTKDREAEAIANGRMSLINLSSDSESSDVEFVGTSTGTPKKSGILDSEDDDDECEFVDMKIPGRRNIRAVKSDEALEEETKRAAKEEEERTQRLLIKERNLNDALSQSSTVMLQGLILDVDDSNEPIVVVNFELTQKLKKHQRAGIRFMWNTCYESVSRLKNYEGTGCILAHCMGLGKTLQAIALIHTLFTHPVTNTRHVLIVCPLSTVLNWENEFQIGIDNLTGAKKIKRYLIGDTRKDKRDRINVVEEWRETTGVLIMGYEAYQTFVRWAQESATRKQKMIEEALIDPGPDLVICDEGHLLKNGKNNRTRSLMKIKTKRRIILTGTPLQNNLVEYYYMVRFVKPNLLGTLSEYSNRFINPIINGQYDDSTADDIQLMRMRSHVLHKILIKTVQRYEVTELLNYLPKITDYVVNILLHPVQIDMYKTYLDKVYGDGVKGGKLFTDFHNLRNVWTHPYLLYLLEQHKTQLENKSRQEVDTIDTINSDMINVDTRSVCKKGTDEQPQVLPACLKITDDRLEFSTCTLEAKNPLELSTSEPLESSASELLGPSTSDKLGSSKSDELPPGWWKEFCPKDFKTNIDYGPKFKIMISILEECDKIKDKILIFSSSLAELDSIEYFLKTHGTSTCRNWRRKEQYLRMDGTVPPEIRMKYCNQFNNPENDQIRAFLISHRVGGLGLNLVAANRIILMDVNFNPAYDLQSIFRIYRFGQRKHCFVYRLVAKGTMEEVLYERSVTKLAVAGRVVDQLQIPRHYKCSELQKMYRFKVYTGEPIVPRRNPSDEVLSHILNTFQTEIYSYHEHQSLLENLSDEVLNEAEMKTAWEQFNQEKEMKNKVPQEVPKTQQASSASNVIRVVPTSVPYNLRRTASETIAQNSVIVIDSDLLTKQQLSKNTNFAQPPPPLPKQSVPENLFAAKLTELAKSLQSVFGENTQASTTAIPLTEIQINDSDSRIPKNVAGNSKDSQRNVNPVVMKALKSTGFKQFPFKKSVIVDRNNKIIGTVPDALKKLPPSGTRNTDDPSNKKLSMYNTVLSKMAENFTEGTSQPKNTLQSESKPASGEAYHSNLANHIADKFKTVMQLPHHEPNLTITKVVDVEHEDLLKQISYNDSLTLSTVVIEKENTNILTQQTDNVIEID